MGNDENKAVQSRDDRLRGILSGHESSSKIGLVIGVVFFIVAVALINWVSRSGGVVMLFGNPIPVVSFAGVFSSLANFCVIFLVVFYKKPGFIVSLVLLLVQFPVVIWGMVASHNLVSIPGLFSNVFAIVVIVLIYSNISKNDEYQARIREQAITDRFTGLPNRFACSEVIDKLIEDKKEFAVATFDLNNFKSINDTMGKATGDLVLIEIASRLQKAVDADETKTQDFLTYQGGDEFTVVLRGFAEESDIDESLAYYESALEKKLTIDDCDYVITASIGFALYPADANNSSDLYTFADAAMYEAKRIGGDHAIRRFTPELIATEHTLEMERKIRTALDNGKLNYHLQPQFDITQRLRGFEALARMTDEDGNPVSPAEFIPVAEKVGLVDKIDSSVFRNSAMFLGELIRQTGTDVTLSVNVSVRHLMKNDFVDEVRNILSESGVPANQIDIEITESIMIDSAEKALQCINEIKKMGVKVAIDDFGTGYSSLSYLSTFPADLLKVDKSFIDKMNSSNSSKQYVAAIISIGHIMNYGVIAEGVEDAEQMETLREIGCDFIQGFLWGRPIPPDQARELVVQG